MSEFGPAEFGPASFGGDPSVAGLLLEIDAEVTSLARRLLARKTTDGTAFKAIEFALGRGGVDPFDYKTAVPVNPDAQSLEIPIALAPKAVTEYERPNIGSGCTYCVVDPGEANEVLSEIGIWAEILWSPYTAEIGTVFLAAIAHFPIVCKNSSMSYAFRVNVQF